MNPTEQAKKIAAEAAHHGLTVLIDNELRILTVQKAFTPNDTDAYLAAENGAYAVLRLLRQTRPGSTWGTDSGSVGGHAGLVGGFFRMNKSGGDKRVLKALWKELT